LKTGRIILIAAILLIGAVIYFNKFGNDKQKGPQQPQGPQALNVNGVVVSYQRLEDNIFSSGTLLANDEVEIRNEIAGRITSLLFKEGTRVKKGELLLTIYDEDLTAQLRKLESQKAIAQKTVNRQEDLMKVNGISQQEYELSQNELSSIQADIDLIQSQLSKTKIRAPFDGIIGLRSVSIGAYLPINSHIATIQAIDPLKVEFSVPEKYRLMISDTGTIHFTTESAEGTFTGKIFAFEPKIDLQTRSVQVRALVRNEGLKLFPGAFVHITIPLKQLDKAILIPTQSLVPEIRGEKVFVVRKDSAIKVDVETGVRNDSMVQVTSGVNEGDTVLTTGIMQVRPGTKLKIKVNAQLTSK
jgi:membrane fusion protein (multidrug efflux system)